MRTRAHNAGIKKWRLVNERKRAKAACSPPAAPNRTPPPPRRTSPATSIALGERFDRLTAMARAEDYVHPRGELRERWVFECECGVRVTWQVSWARFNVRHGWCSCQECWRAHVVAGRNIVSAQ